MGAKWIWIGRCDKEKKAIELADWFPFKNPVAEWKILIGRIRGRLTAKIIQKWALDDSLWVTFVF